MDKERSTVCSHGNADDLLKNVPSELSKYVIIRNFNILRTSFSV